MTISIGCPDGHKLKVNEAFAGRSVNCPACGATMIVPTPRTDPHVTATQNVTATQTVGRLFSGTSPGAVTEITKLRGWMVFGSSSKEISQANPTTGVTQPSPVSAETMQPPSATNKSASQAIEVTSPVTSLAVKAAPTDLQRIELDERLMGFDLPGLTWASAYDESSGHLAVTHDEYGVLIYDLDDLLQAKVAIKSSLHFSGSESD
jgi:hypothetical protein